MEKQIGKKWTMQRTIRLFSGPEGLGFREISVPFGASCGKNSVFEVYVKVRLCLENDIFEGSGLGFWRP